MLRLSTSREARWVDLAHGVAVKMRTPGQFDFDLAAEAARAAARKLAGETGSLRDYALDHLASGQAELAAFLGSADPAGLVGYGKLLLAAHLGMLVIEEVRGVAGLDGQPLCAPNLRDLAALFQTLIPGAGGASFGSVFLAIAEQGAALEISEGNASAAGPAGHSGAAASTAPDAAAPDSAAPAAAAARKAPSARKRRTSR